MELSQAERAFLLEMLDRINVQGIKSKIMVVQIMAKLAAKEKAAEAEVEHEQD